MRGYSETEIFSTNSSSLVIYRKAQVLVDMLDPPDPLVRCHELTRAVHQANEMAALIATAQEKKS